MPSIASLLRPSKSTSNLKAAAAGSSTLPPQLNTFQTDITKRPFLTLATPCAGTPSTPVSTSLLSASLKCLESEIPEPFYAIRTKEHLSVIWRRDFRLGRVKVGSIRWPRRGGHGNGQDPSSEAQDEGVRIRFAGREHIGVESLLDPPSKSGSRYAQPFLARPVGLIAILLYRKFHIPHLGHPIKWKQHGAAGSGVYWVNRYFLLSRVFRRTQTVDSHHTRSVPVQVSKALLRPSKRPLHTIFLDSSLRSTKPSTTQTKTFLHIAAFLFSFWIILS